MSVFGDSRLWSVLFPDERIPEILDLVLTTWETFPKPQPDADEVEITRFFRIALIRTKRGVRLPVRIDREAYEDDLETGEHLGRLDLKFVAAECAAEENYFTFECKRLNAIVSGAVRPYASEYVTKGMMRFIEQRYAYAQNHGGMIGYVLDGDLPHAQELVHNNIRDKRAELRMDDPARLQTSSLRSSIEAVKETGHNFERGRFQIHHVFLCNEPLDVARTA